MQHITAEKLQHLLEEGETLHVVDVREDFEVAHGMIPEAIHIPLGELSYRISELDQRVPYIFVCKAGVRSYNAATYMESMGFETTNLSDGMLGWLGPLTLLEVEGNK